MERQSVSEYDHRDDMITEYDYQDDMTIWRYDDMITFRFEFYAYP